jgi:hypothetical protein
MSIVVQKVQENTGSLSEKNIPWDNSCTTIQMQITKQICKNRGDTE